MKQLKEVESHSIASSLQGWTSDHVKVKAQENKGQGREEENRVQIKEVFTYLMREEQASAAENLWDIAAFTVRSSFQMPEQSTQ